ncbi:uncharacterized protein H6S33_007475 [Morchella sextelata]|uniref:uncharacterized protein n=1 Tax=Morchella sextelata TaxID=1174677 RepID=UPI001D042811|nr:uncharacterized protein H6S33_007475 [Morchella sextelata]KAH0603816.1 hypothetical protein H6S33_007475 [Morchella sextelata]
MTSNGSSSSSATDLISAACSLVATAVSLITLITAYVAALQILSRRQLYRLGISEKSLGGWKDTVMKPSLLKMQTQISTPTITVPMLLMNGFQPNTIGLPDIYIKHDTKNTVSHLEAGNYALADAGWVNFTQALGVTPRCTRLYEMQPEPKLVDGIVPMRWKGIDLVAICSMLSFNSPENNPNFQMPLTLPTLWSGPLGWLQFRAGSDGCVVEYRRRSAITNHIPNHLHEYYRNLDIKFEACSLEPRAWHSISCLSLHDGRALFLGGSDTSSDIPKVQRDDVQPTKVISDHVLSEDEEDEDIMRILWPKKADRPYAVYTAADENGSSGISNSDFLPEFLRGVEISNDAIRKANKLQVWDLSLGLFRLIVERELAVSRGLDFTACIEFDRRYMDPKEFDNYAHHYPFALGKLRMDESVMKLMKQAVLEFRPDGFFFSPTERLLYDIYQIFRHIDLQSDRNLLGYIFPPLMLQDWQRGTKDQQIEQLYYAMTLCNKLQHIKMRTQALSIVEDIKITYLATSSLRQIIASREGLELIWAMIASSKLFSDIVMLSLGFKVQNILESTIKCKHGDLHWKFQQQGTSQSLERVYVVPFLSDGDFSGAQILAAFLHVFLTYFWVEVAVVSNVALYDATVPQSITMY